MCIYRMVAHSDTIKVVKLVVLESVLVGVFARHHCDARGSAGGLRIVLGEYDTLLRQRGHIRRRIRKISGRVANVVPT